MTLAEFKSKYEKVPVDEFPNEVPDDVKVSVCVQTYQHAPYIEECLNSILAQETDFNYEILLGEDASTDGTRDICIRYAKEHPTKIRLFLHHRENNILINGNPSGRFNLLYNFNSAKGKYIAICEGDDYWTDSLKLQKQVDFLEKNPSCKLSITNSKYFYQEQGIFKPFTIPKKYINKSSNVVDPMYTFSKKGVVFSMASFMFRKNEIFDILFKELQSVMNFSDRAIQLRALKDGSICCLPDVTSVYRVAFKGDSWTSQNINKYSTDKITKTMKIKDFIYYDFFNGKFNKYRKYDDSAFLSTEIYKAGKAKGKWVQFKLLLIHYNKITFKDLWTFLIPRIILK